MATLQTFKVQGQTTGDVAIATKTVTIDSDGYVRFTDAQGYMRAMQMSGDLARFMKEVLTGTNGLTTAVTE